MSLSKNKGESFPERWLKEYVRLLRERPVITKAITSGFITGLGQFLSQIITREPQRTGHFNWRALASFTTFGFAFSGPLIHYFYTFLDQWVPPGTKYATIKKVLIDRFILAPPFLLMFFYVTAILDGQGHTVAAKKIQETFLPALLMNWRVWTVLQYINIKYVPREYRVLFGSAVALCWNIYLAIQRR
ncbi:unnamed protein product [Owenia fusiformis]|uniref:Uncharacterized protein n=1 Tax=Owenia fusiformis TaxID=6347 RepID=A0A8J1XLK8_OWEFU|nr:unnamed protein product [Owenia fusiformis]